MDHLEVYEVGISWTKKSSSTNKKGYPLKKKKVSSKNKNLSSGKNSYLEIYEMSIFRRSHHVYFFQLWLKDWINLCAYNERERERVCVCMYTYTCMYINSHILIISTVFQFWFGDCSRIHTYTCMCIYTYSSSTEREGIGDAMKEVSKET